MSTNTSPVVDSPLPSNAEMRALAAQSFHFLSNFNVIGVRQALEPFLNEIGRNGIFAQYTRHDISHIDTLLEMLDWVVIPETAAVMTPVDWMLVVLAIYFHDAGLAVTNNEFAQRNETSFPAFRDSIVTSSEPSPYKEHVEALAPEERERFLYQEFVRTHHPERIKLWISGAPSNHLGVATEARDEIVSMVSNLDPAFRDDLALVCASHHKDDLNDLSAYLPQRAYGTSLKETANLQFAAILLRTVDLLHVTKDRTPSVSFRLTTPSDPKSIEEWHKQMSVVSVRKSGHRDENGNVDPSAIPDTIAVTAAFRDPLGFFSLTEYLFYVEQQLKQSWEWAAQTNVKEALSFVFPWKKIDSSQVKAIDFESKQFVFELDKPRILKLLTGHTLYRNSDVVLRELIQNSLDATRLQTEIDSHAKSISLHLDSDKRTITVTDDGTGMTQRIIERHFLNVGSSRYQDEEFRKQYPKFNAISRFGIGILSIFMISDEIEVITKSDEEPKARNISIRSINGRYLIRMIDPSDPAVPDAIKSHGTSIRMRLRAGVSLPDIIKVAQFWILFPGCALTAQVDKEPVCKIGFASPKEALEDFLRRAGLPLFSLPPDDFSPAYKVIETTKEGLTLAVALQWQPSFKCWTFAAIDRLSGLPKHEQVHNGIAVCVQGIRVESSTPGFAGTSVIAMSNVIGASAPATNVARSNLESSVLVDEMFDRAYEIYAKHISDEIDVMSKERGMSISQAASEGRYLLAPLSSTQLSNPSKNAESFARSLSSIPWLTLDQEGERVLTSIGQLKQLGGFWTMESGIYTSAEGLVRRMPTGVSLAKLAALSTPMLHLPPGNILSGHAESTRVMSLILADFDVDQILVDEFNGNADLHWSLRKNPPLWRGVIPERGEDRARIDQIFLQMQQFSNVRFRSLAVQNSEDVAMTGCEHICGIVGTARTYIFSGNDIHSIITAGLDGVESGTTRIADYALTLMCVGWLIGAGNVNPLGIRSRVLDQLRQTTNQQLNLDADVSFELRALVESFEGQFMNPSRGDRIQSLPMISDPWS